MNLEEIKNYIYPKDIESGESWSDLLPDYQKEIVKWLITHIEFIEKDNKRLEEWLEKHYEDIYYEYLEHNSKEYKERINKYIAIADQWG